MVFRYISPSLTVADYKAFFAAYLFYSKFRAKADELKDTAHSEYDLEIRRLAETAGFAAFSKEYIGEKACYIMLYKM